MKKEIRKEGERRRERGGGTESREARIREKGMKVKGAETERTSPWVHRYKAGFLNDSPSIFITCLEETFTN